MKFLIVIPIGLKSQAEAFSKQLDPLSIGDYFTTPLRFTGTEEITHYASLPNITDGLACAAIRQMLSSEDFISGGGISRECEASIARKSFLELIAENGLEEIPPAPENDQ